ncbi:MAG: hypothetical protein K2P18_01855, partial [Oscillospiraceae bacterium]|nr:hypothetical protein [Oscillospiraceae bacterium]
RENTIDRAISRETSFLTFFIVVLLSEHGRSKTAARHREGRPAGDTVSGGTVRPIPSDSLIITRGKIFVNKKSFE